MKHLRMLKIAAVAVAALLIGVASASANPLTSPEGTSYTSTIKAESTNSKFEGSFITVECAGSSVEGKIESHGTSSAEGKLSSLGFSGCNSAVTVLKAGSFKIHGAISKKGTVTSSGAEISVETSVGTCVFTTSNTDVGTITDSAVTKGSAVLDVGSATLPRTGGSFLCGTTGSWTGSYSIASPSTLYLDSSADTPSPLTSPEGTSYTGTIKTESESPIKFDGNFSTVECSKSSFEVKIEAHDPSFAEGKASSLAFSECNYPVEVVFAGSLQVHTGEDNSGTATWFGALIKIKSSVGDCIYMISGVDVGVVTDSDTTKGNATLDLSSAELTRAGGSSKCSTLATWTGSYKFATPSTLYLHGTTSPPLTSPEGTAFTSTLKAESTNSELHGSFVTIKCANSTVEGKIESHVPTSAEGKLSGLSFSSCNYAVTVSKAGALKIHAGKSNRGTVTSSGAEISIATSVGTCVFTTSSTDIGTLTDTTVTKGNAVLDLNSSKIPRTAGNFLCGASGTWTGSYKVMTPSTLYVD